MDHGQRFGQMSRILCGMTLRGLLGAQCGIATRAQLRAAGLTPDQIRAHLDACRWRSLNAVVICTHSGPLTPLQAQVAVVLSTHARVALCGLTALNAHGLRGFATDEVHVLVRRGSRVLSVPDVDVRVHESRRFDPSDVLPRFPPITRVERSTVDAAAWSPDIKSAIRVTVAPVQQRLTTPARLREALTAAGQIRFGPVLRPFVADLEGGAEALSEVAFLRWCRRHRFPEPTCNIRCDDLGRRRYLDATFELSGGAKLIAEIDGGIHLTLAVRWLDTIKDNEAVIAGIPTLRFPSVAIYCDDPEAKRQLRTALEVVSARGCGSTLSR